MSRFVKWLIIMAWQPAATGSKLRRLQPSIYVSFASDRAAEDAGIIVEGLADLVHHLGGSLRNPKFSMQFHAGYALEVGSHQVDGYRPLAIAYP